MARTTPAVNRVGANLPPEIANLIIHWSIGRGYTAAQVRAGLQAAEDFQNQTSWRCAACYRWHNTANLPIIAMTPEGIRPVNVCEQCERKLNDCDSMAAAIEGYVGPFAAEGVGE